MSLALPKWALAAVAALWPQWQAEAVTQFNGYLEGEYLYPAAATPGRIDALMVREGQIVARGDPLFRLDNEQQLIALAAAQARAEAAEANLANLATGSREAEIEVIRATLARAEADRALAATTLARSERLYATGNISEARVETDRTALAVAQAQVGQLTAQLHVAELPARSAQRIAAEAQLRAAQAEAAAARRNLSERLVTAPEAGRVEKVYFSAGEVVGIGAPVLRLLPEHSLLAIFFIAEEQRAAYAPGQVFDLYCSACPEGMTAVLTRIEDQPQFTSPIIYSETERARLVFRAEARIEGTAPVMPGQPVSLRPAK